MCNRLPLHLSPAIHLPTQTPCSSTGIADNFNHHTNITQVLPLLLVTYRWYNNPRAKSAPAKSGPASSASKPQVPKTKDVEWYYKRLKKEAAVEEKLLR